MAWCFEDECDAVLDALSEIEAWVPPPWPVEVANVLLVAKRRGHLTSADSTRFIELLGGLPIMVDDHAHERALGPVLSTGREIEISAYDATYLEFAMRLGAPVATRDDRLRAACVRAGMTPFETD